MATQSKKLSFGEKFCYGLGDCSANVVVALAGTYLTGYFTDTVGIAAAAIGTMMLLVRIFDGVTDIVMGAVVDKTKSKYGKARPWLLWTAPFMAIALILIFNVPSSLSDAGKLVYIYITYIFQSCIVYTANNLPYNALLSRMTLDVQDRASAASLRFVMTQLTNLIVNSLTATLLAKGTSWMAISIAYGVVSLLMLIISFCGVKEHLDADESSGVVKVKNVPLKESLPALLKNRYFFIQSLLFCFLYIGTVANGMMTYYFCNIVLGNIAILTLASMATTIPAMVVNLVMPRMVRMCGKRKLMIIGSILYMVGGLFIGAAGSNVPIVLTGLVIKGFGMGPIMSGIFAMTADVVDYGEWKTGVRSEGLVNSCTSFGMKVGIGLGSAVGSWLLALGHYDGMLEVQPDSAVAMIRFGYGYLGTVIGAVVLVLCLMMNIDKYIAQIQTDLEAKRA